MGFNFGTYKKLEKTLSTISGEVGAPKLEKEAIAEHIKKIFTLLKEGSYTILEGISEKETEIYVKKFVGSTFRVPKKKKVKTKVVTEKKKVESKKKNFRTLPPTTMVMDDWKFKYCNSAPEEASTYFWNNLDRETHALYYGKYKYNEELEKMFMTSNLVSGFFQQCDKFKRYVFGVVHILGSEETGLELEFCLLLRGKDIAYFTDNAFFGTYFDWSSVDEKEKFVNSFWWAKDTWNDKVISETHVLK